MADGNDDWQLAVFHVETDADVHPDYWEMHPAGEEAVCCLRGAFRLYLRAPDSDAAEAPVSVRAGQAVIVPRGTWHRLELDEPSDIMSITLRRGTQRERRVTA
jgi:quercetin dioxygenase-like cupin family protein